MLTFCREVNYVKLNMVCRKFTRRFQFMEECAKSKGKYISDYTLEELDAFWDKAKQVLEN